MTDALPGATPPGTPLAAAAAHHGSNPDSLVCGVCGRVLERVRVLVEGEPDSVHWRHLRLDETADHPAIPVAVSINAQLRCDFCSEEMHLLDGWVVPAETFEMGAQARGERGDSTGNWKACRLCVLYVKKKNWDGLVKRVLNKMQTTQGLEPWMRKAVSAELLRMYGLLAKSMTGRPYEVSTPQR